MPCKLSVQFYQQQACLSHGWMRVLPPIHASPAWHLHIPYALVLVMTNRNEEHKNARASLRFVLCWLDTKAMMLLLQGAPARRQPPPGTASMSHQYPRAMPSGPQQSGHQEFDPGLLFQLLQAPSFAPAADEMNQNKRKHDQLQVHPIASCSSALWA